MQKIQIVKCSGNYWYKNKQFPINTDVIEAKDKEIYDYDDANYNYFFSNYDMKDFYYSKQLFGYIAKSDCINNEQYSLSDNPNVANIPINVELDVIKRDAESRTFESGAKRDSNSNKPFCHNFKAYSRLRFGYHMTKGANKYGDNNWLKGLPNECYLESVDRHLALYISGDRSEDHLSAIIFGIQGCMVNEEKEGIKANHYFIK